MTVAFDAVTPTAGITPFTTTTPFTFDHTPVGTPRGVIVGIWHGETSSDLVTSVSYGGVAMTRVESAVDTATEPGRSYMYFLGASIPTGTQTVSIVHTGSADSKVAVCATVTAAADTEIGAFGKIDEDVTNPQLALDTGLDDSLRFCALYGGKATPSDYTAVTDVQAVGSSPRVDFGARVGVFGWQTSAASSGSFTIGYTAATSDDVAFVAVAVQEAGAAAQNLAGTLFTKAPTFNTGAVSTGPVNLAGTLFTKAPTFPTGAVSQAGGPQSLTGSLFTKAPTFNVGALVASQSLTGALFQKAPTFFVGSLSKFPGAIPATKVVAWYAARFTAGVHGNTLATVPDLADNGANDLFQNNSGARATWLDDIVNGLPTLRFDGGDKYTAAWNQTIAEPYQVFIVLNTRTPFGLDNDEVYFSGFSSDATDKHLFAIVNHTLATVNTPIPPDPPWWMIEQAGANQHVVGATPINERWYVVRIDFETTDLITLNGVATTAEGNAGSLSSTGITLGAREDGNRETTGDIAELIFTINLTTTEKAAVEDELIALYGIEGQLNGTLFQKAPTFFAGTVTVGTTDLAGVLFQNVPTFGVGVVNQEGGPQNLGGDLFAKAPTFPQGSVTTGVVGLTGVLFQNTPVFNQGAVTADYNLDGVLFQNTPTFPAGEVIQEQILVGVLFQSSPVFFVGSTGVAGAVDGILFQNTPVFFVGTLGQVGGSFWRPDPAGYTVNPVAFVRVGRNDVPPWPIEIHGEEFELAPTFFAGAVT